MCVWLRIGGMHFQERAPRFFGLDILALLLQRERILPSSFCRGSRLCAQRRHQYKNDSELKDPPDKHAFTPSFNCLSNARRGAGKCKEKGAASKARRALVEGFGLEGESAGQLQVAWIPRAG